MDNEQNESKTHPKEDITKEKTADGSKDIEAKNQKSKQSLNKSEGEIVLNTIKAESKNESLSPSKTTNLEEGKTGDKLTPAEQGDKPLSEKSASQLGKTPSGKSLKKEEQSKSPEEAEKLESGQERESNIEKSLSQNLVGSKKSQQSIKSGQKKDEHSGEAEKMAENQATSDQAENANEPPRGRAELLRSVLTGRRQPERRSNLDNRTVEVLESLKDQVVMFQERRGIPRDNYTFSTVISAIMTLAVQAIYSVFGLMLALAPVTEIAIHVARFTLERLCEIAYTRSRQDIAIKMVLFTLQLLTILFLATFIFGTILLPVYMMGIIIVSKIASIIPGS